MISSFKKILSRHKVLIFPITLLLVLLILTGLRISGTSIGIYHEYLYGETSRDPNLLYGKPQSIRSDEWLVNTQLTIAQAQNGYQRFNKDFNVNKDMSILGDSPYLDWSAIFKPQNFSFFVLPIEYAFAFKWWFMLFSLITSVYFFSLKLLPGKIWIAIASSIIIGFSPFIAWWYLTGTIGTLCYAFLILLVSMSLIERQRIAVFKKSLTMVWSDVLKTTALIYLLVSFALILYPPFQIPIAIAVFFFLLGYLLDYISRKHISKKMVLKIITPFLVAVILTGVSVGAFVVDHSKTIATIGDTAYPGKRIVSPGGYDIVKLLNTYLQPQLQQKENGTKYDKNQSESSSFIMLPLYFVLPAIILFAWIRRKTKEIDWTLLSLIVCYLLFLTTLFIPHTNLLSKVFLFELVPQYRMVIGFGLLGIILPLYMLKTYTAHKLIMTRRIQASIVTYSAAFFGAMVWAGLETSRLYPEFITGKKIIVLLAGTLVLGLTLLLLNKPRLGLAIIALFSVFSVINVNPLYVGLGPIRNSEISKTIVSLSSPNSTWAAAQDLFIENLPQMSGRKAVTGVSTYPSTDFWKKYSSEHNSSVYNRYAHIVLSSNDTSSLVLATPDLVTVSASCTRKITEKIDYIVSTTPLAGSCNTLVKTLRYPNATFFFYKQ